MVSQSQEYPGPLNKKNKAYKSWIFVAQDL